MNPVPLPTDQPGDGGALRRRPTAEGPPCPPWVDPVLIGLATLGMAAWSWRKWPDVLVDYGQQLYVAWRIAEGEVLYRDLQYFHGPLSAYLHGALMRLFGVGLTTLALFNLALLLALVALLYHLLRAVGGRLAATAACLVFILMFAFSQYLAIGNYNYVCPYTHEITHGLALSLAAIACLGRFARRGRRRWLFASGGLLGLVFLTKVEVFLAAAAALAAGLAAALWPRRTAGGSISSALAVFASGAALAPALAFLLFGLATTPAQAAAGLASPYLALLQPEALGLDFYRANLGLDDPVANLRRLLTAAAGYLLVLAPPALLALLGQRVRPAVRGLALAALALTLALALPLPAWMEVGRPLPLVSLLLVLGAMVHLARQRRRGSGDGAAVLGLGLAVFAAALLAKMVLAARLYHYGFALAMPGALLLVVALLDGLPRWIDRRGGSGRTFRAGAAAVLAVAVLAHLTVTRQAFAARRHPVGQGADRFWADGRGPYVQAMLADLARWVGPGETLLVVPDGIMLNYLARRVSPVPYLNFVPTEVVVYGEDRILADLEARPPDFVVLVEKSTLEFGPRYFGQDYARRLGAWIEAHYRPVLTRGAPPLAGRGFGIELRRRQEPGP